MTKIYCSYKNGMVPPDYCNYVCDRAHQIGMENCDILKKRLKTPYVHEDPSQAITQVELEEVATPI